MGSGCGQRGTGRSLWWRLRGRDDGRHAARADGRHPDVDSERAGSRVAVTEPDADGNADRDPQCNADADPDTNGLAHANTEPARHPNANGDAHDTANPDPAARAADADGDAAGELRPFVPGRVHPAVSAGPRLRGHPVPEVPRGRG